MKKLQYILITKNKYKNQKIQSIYTLNYENKYQNIKIRLKPLFCDVSMEFTGIKLNLEKRIKKEKNITLNSKQINNLFHELRAPLFNIRSFLETLYEYNDELTSNEKLEFIEIAASETNRLSHLVRDILDFSELDNEKYITESECCLEKIVTESLQLNKIIATNKKLLLIKSINIKENTLVKNLNYLTRILSNLISNSVKFTYPEGIIYTRIRSLQAKKSLLYSNKKVIRLSIIDNGIGISKKDTKHILNRFERGNNGTNTVPGSGLGLPIVKEILLKERQVLNLSTNVLRGTSASFNLIKSK